jgi:cold shock CspA family protein
MATEKDQDRPAGVPRLRTEHRARGKTARAAAAGEPCHGRVQRIYVERGFGFIRCLDGAEDDIGQDFFFHMSGLTDCAIGDLEEGSLVSFTPTYVAKGKRAEAVTREEA